MNIEYMREFVTLSGCLNYTLAAQKLHISQPTLTRHINSIEKEIGVPLLIRSTHNVELTPFGEIVCKEYSGILSQYDDLIEKLKMLTKGYANKLCLGTLYYGIGVNYSTPLVKAFRKKSTVQLSIISCQPHQIIQKIEDGSIDIGISIHSKFIPNDKIIYVPIRKERLYAIVLPSHPLARKQKISLRELSQEQIIVMEAEIEHKIHIETLFKYHDIDAKNIIYTEQIDTFLLTMEETNGVFIGTKQLALPEKELVFVDIDSDDFYLDICLLYRADNMNPAIFDMIDCIDSIGVSPLESTK